MHTDTVTIDAAEAAYRAEWCRPCGTAPCAGTCPEAIATARADALADLDDLRASWAS